MKQGFGRASCAALVLCGGLLAPAAQAGFFSGRIGDLKDLVAANQIDAAMQFMIREQAYFAKLTGEDAAWVDAFRKRLLVDNLQAKIDSGSDLHALELLKSAAPDFAALPPEQRPRYQGALASLDARGETQATESIGRLVAANSRNGDMRRWKELTPALADARTRSAALKSLPAQLPRSVQAAQRLDQALAQVENELRAEARPAFVDYGYFTEPAFHRVYPLQLKMASLADQNPALEQALQGASLAQLRRFGAMYMAELGESWKLRLSRLYFNALVAERRPRSYFEKQALRREARAQGYSVAENGNVMLMVWPGLAANQGRLILKAPSQTPYRLLQESDKPSEVLAGADASQQDLLVFLRVTPVRAQRNVTARSSIKSQYQSGTRRVSNPAWAEAREAVSKAERDLAEARASAAESRAKSGGSTLDIAMGLLNVVGEASAESDLEDARRQLAQTPQQLEEAIMLPYSYTRTDIEVVDQWQLAAAVYDSSSRRSWTYGSKRSSRGNFIVFDGLNSADPDAAALSAKGTTLAAVDEYQKKPSQDDYEKMWNDVLAAYRKAMTGN